MRIITSLIMLSAVLISSARTVERYEADIPDFTELKVAADINVVYSCNPDSAGKAVFFTTEDMASEIAFSHNKKKLTVEFTTKAARFAVTPTVKVYSRSLTLAENHADSLLRLENLAPGSEIKLRLMGNGRISAPEVDFKEVSASITSGNGTISVSGNCDKANLTSLSVGTIQADRLKARVVKCKLVGSGEIGCWPIDELNISFGVNLGSGTVLYRGEPKVIKSRSAGITLKRIEE